MPKKGYRQTPEHRANISKAGKHRVFTDEHKAALSSGKKLDASIKRAKKALLANPDLITKPRGH